MADTSYNVSVYAIEARKNAAGKVTSYRVGWKVGTQTFREPFKKSAQADSFRSDLVSAARKGEAFSLSTGRPVSWQRATNRMSWYEFACAFADRKWKDASAKHRADIARVLMLATVALLKADRGRPDDKAIRHALSRWAYNTKQRPHAPEHVISVLKWVSQNLPNVDVLADPEVLESVLDAITTRQDGKRMAAVTVKKYRGILHNALEYAVLRKALLANPLTGRKWITVRASSEVDRRSVINPAQGRAFLAAVEKQDPSGRRLVALFGAMLYCGLRPEEAVEIAEHNLILPTRVLNPATGTYEDPSEEEDWGELYVGPVAPEVARDWTDSGERRDSREMPKHRAEGETRGPIPIPPVQVRLFRRHLEEFGTGKEGRLFRGVRADVVPGETIRKVFGRAREKVLTAKEQDSPLMKRPYDLRHTCLSTWLNAGIPPKQVAEWAGNSVDVLLKTYAKCMVGQDAAARRRIAEALKGG
ncbi:integrase [Actinomadura sp. NBRC 104412]|uniref:tyrosine-type recombinase/integrase n=1 Tax=Actinomadura sp. NBRC 104412 TaxID=3032203 RepID=UPI0024A41FD5|nr:integrase [Actinomadura sp. NBRC 104412]GLZ05270.1 integrase [Actinomadura sp. NBRC 104412]